MEFRQAMRDLGLMGEGTGYNKNDVDALFSELDADSGGDLDLSELTAALKGLRLRAQSVLQQEIVAKEKAEYWKDRAERTREAAAKVEEWERATVELHEVRTNPSPESKLGALILKRGLKPADILTALLPESDSKKRQSDIDEETFSTGIIGLGVECTREELGAIFQRLDADGGGTLDYEELKEAIKDLSEAKNVALAHEKALVKKVAQAEREAKEMQLAIKVQLAEDEKKKAAEAEAKAKADEEARKAAEAAEADGKAKEEAKLAAKKKKEEEFEKKIMEKRKTRDDSEPSPRPRHPRHPAQRKKRERAARQSRQCSPPSLPRPSSPLLAPAPLEHHAMGHTLTVAALLLVPPALSPARSQSTRRWIRLSRRSR